MMGRSREAPAPGKATNSLRGDSEISGERLDPIEKLIGELFRRSLFAGDNNIRYADVELSEPRSHKPILPVLIRQPEPRQECA